MTGFGPPGPEEVERFRQGLPSWVSPRGPKFDDPISWIGGFANSAASSVVEMFGADPGRNAEAFREQYPYAGLMSELVGVPVPYVGWGAGLARAGRASKGVARMASAPARLGKRLGGGVIGGVARGATEFAPLHLGMAAGQLAGGEAPGDVAAEFGVNQLLGGAIGGVAGLFGKAGRQTSSRALTREIPELGPDTPLQLQIRALDTRMEGLPQDLRNAAASRRNALADQVRQGERTPASYVRPLETGDARRLNGLFKPGGDKIKRHRLVADPAKGGLGSDAAWRDVLIRAGLPNDWAGYVQYLRYAKDTGGKGSLGRAIGRSLAPVGGDWFMAKEAGDGMFILARKLSPEEYVYFKTDTPSKFVTQAGDWARRMVNRSAWQMDVNPLRGKQGLEIADFIDQTRADIPFRDYTAWRGDRGKWEQLGEKLGISRALGENGRYLRERMATVWNDFISPAMFRFRASPRAQHAYMQMRMAFDYAENQANKLMYGTQQLGKGKSAFGAVARANKTRGGVAQYIDRLSDDDMRTLQQIYIRGMDLAEAKALGLSQELDAFLTQMDALDTKQIDQLQRTMADTNGETFTPRKGHFMMTRTWQGSWRVPIYNGADLLYVASGKSRGDAQKEADKILAAGNGRWHAGNPAMTDLGGDLNLSRQIQRGHPDFVRAVAARTPEPGFFREREGIGGYIGQRETMTRRELEDIIAGHTRRINRYMAEATWRDRFAGDLMYLQMENPEYFKQLMQSLDDVAGRQGVFAQWQNQAVDKVLGPMLGKDSASKVVRAINESVYHLQLGFANIAFPALNALTFLQTTLPHLAFVGSAPARKLAPYYSHFVTAGENGRPRGSMGAVDMLRLTGKSLREMGNMGPELRAAMERAAGDGTIDPRFVEEFVGAGQRKLSIRALRDKDATATEFIRELSSFLPSMSEKFARSHTFTLGHIVGRDFLNLRDDALYSFAKQFTNNTMYLYGTADRARMMTGPLGSLFGLFKNWQLHYLYQMADYVGEAFGRGNFKPLLWGAAGTATVGGAAATPMFWAADQMSQLFTNQGLVEHLYGSLGPGSVTDAIYLGLPTFLGTSLSGSAAAPGADPARDASLLWSFVQWDRMKAMGQMFGGAWDRFATTGQHPIDSGEVRDAFIRAFAPKTIMRVAQSLEDNVLTSLTTGYPSVAGVGLAEKLMYIFGFTPTAVEKNYQVLDKLWRDKEARIAAVRSMGKAWVEAEESGDFDTLTDITRTAMARGVDISSVIRSANARRQAGEVPSVDRGFDPAEVARWQALGLLGTTGP